MENESKIEKIKKCCCGDPKIILIFMGMLLVATIVIIALVRERIVNPNLNQVTVNGEGKISYQPDIATITLGVQIDKAATAEEALRLLDEKMKGIIAAVKTAGIAEGDIKTKAFSLSPQYDFKDGASTVSGYAANQQLEIKARGIDKNSEIVSQAVAAANGAGVNQILSVSFDVSSLNDLKQQARIEAIKDARSKASALAKAAGVKKLKKVIGWYENVVQSPDVQNDYGYGGMASEKATLSARPSVAPQVPSGNQEIIINVGVNYEVD
jgi:uncharacterized protein YggE